MAFARTIATTHTKTLIAPSTGIEDKVYGADYVSASSHTSTGAVSGAVSGGIPYFDSTTSEASSALLAAGAVVLGGGAGAAPLTSSKLTESSTAGGGLSIAAGTATTDVQALSATQTWNAAGVTFTGWKYTITDTASAAGSLAMQILGGASGTTTLFSVDKVGGIALYSAGSTVQITSGSTIRFSPGGGGLFQVDSEFRFGNAGSQIHWVSATRIANSSDGVLLLQNDASSGFGRLQFGGTSSSFPSIKRSSATLQARLADDSAYATFDGKFAASGAAGANFGPGAVTSITVVDGIVTAIS